MVSPLLLVYNVAQAASPHRVSQWRGVLVDWDHELDCEGLLCPLPVLKARKRLIAMGSGQVLCVRATDRMALIDLPHYCREAGHSYLGVRDDGAVTLHLIRRA